MFARALISRMSSSSTSSRTIADHKLAKPVGQSARMQRSRAVGTSCRCSWKRRTQTMLTNHAQTVRDLVKRGGGRAGRVCRLSRGASTGVCRHKRVCSIRRHEARSHTCSTDCQMQRVVMAELPAQIPSLSHSGIAPASTTL